MYSQSAPVDSVSWLAFAQTARKERAYSGDRNSFGVSSLSGSVELERPKTSRHKQHPTPDQFADYVQPSPDRGRENISEMTVLSFISRGEEEVLTYALSVAYYHHYLFFSRTTVEGIFVTTNAPASRHMTTPSSHFGCSRQLCKADSYNRLMQ